MPQYLPSPANPIYLNLALSDLNKIQRFPVLIWEQCNFILKSHVIIIIFYFRIKLPPKT